MKLLFSFLCLCTFTLHAATSTSCLDGRPKVDTKLAIASKIFPLATFSKKKAEKPVVIQQFPFELKEENIDELCSLPDFVIFSVALMIEEHKALRLPGLPLSHGSHLYFHVINKKEIQKIFKHDICQSHIEKACLFLQEEERVKDANQPWSAVEIKEILPSLGILIEYGVFVPENPPSYSLLFGRQSSASRTASETATSSHSLLTKVFAAFRRKQQDS